MLIASIAFHAPCMYKGRMNNALKGPVAVALSGGMDSLYSLLSLMESGAEVFALHALFLPPYLRPPDAPEALERLRASAASLGVALHVADLAAAFEDKVIRPFAESYLAGKTPNPCAHCNPSMKFGLLMDEAARLGAAHIATGHYVKRVDEGAGADAAGIYAADDESKDQSYFLALTPPASLQRAIFPLARCKKSAIAAELARRKIEVPQKGESQEICFITDNDYRTFLRDYAARKGFALGGPGPARLPDGKELARHNGLWAYTQGQRRGLGIAWEEPLYVLGKDIAQNALIVGPKSCFGREVCLCGPPNCFVPPEEWPETVLAKTRYRQALAPARAEFCASGLRLEFLDDEKRAPAAPGQIAALYEQRQQGLRLLAGAEIIA